jgi:hypothetical protein
VRGAEGGFAGVLAAGLLAQHPQAATEVLPQATDAATMITPIWPEIARWVLIANQRST